jgi:hypothetical protein
LADLPAESLVPLARLPVGAPAELPFPSGRDPRTAGALVTAGVAARAGVGIAFAGTVCEVGEARRGSALTGRLTGLAVSSGSNPCPGGAATGAGVGGAFDSAWNSSNWL